MWESEGDVNRVLKKVDSLASSHTKIISQNSKISDFKVFDCRTVKQFAGFR